MSIRACVSDDVSSHPSPATPLATAATGQHAAMISNSIEECLLYFGIGLRLRFTTIWETSRHVISYNGIDQYHRPIDGSDHFWLNRGCAACLALCGQVTRQDRERAKVFDKLSTARAEGNSVLSVVRGQTARRSHGRDDPRKRFRLDTR